ncbi:MAG: hypothetical protein BWX77_00703 [Bacteroidetes bacterium ADurb.Bin090]|nr:MAG: hypothetical protein BWX77_00703 [Bacteroidetes bacterium ADurb.Bin090]
MLTIITVASFYRIYDLVGQYTALVAVFTIGEPFGKQGFLFFGTTAAGLSIAHKLNQAFTHLFVSQLHTETVFAEIFEQRVGPGRTVTQFVGGVRRGRYRARINGSTAGGIGHYLAVAKQLGQQFEVRRFAATRTGSRKLKQRSGKL